MDSDPNILMAIKIRDIESRDYIRHRLLNNCFAEQVSANLYEIDTTNWEESDWEHELAYIEENVDPRTDVVHIWFAIDGKLVRTTIGGSRDQ